MMVVLSVVATRLQRVSRCYNRWQTTDINCNRVSSERNAPAIDGLIQSLKEDVRKGDFRKFDINVELLSKTVFVSKAALNREQTQRFTLCLKEWNNQNHSGRQYASVLKFMANLRFSVLNADQKELIVAIVDKFFEKNQQSFRWLGLFLTGIRGLKYSGALLKSNHRQRILESLSELKEDSHERSYAELISGIVGLGINWEEINEAGKRNLLNQLETVKATLTARNINTVIFSFGKLGVDLTETRYKKTIIELAEKVLKELKSDNGKGVDLPREVSHFL
jgi:hypothetical protein